MSKLSAFIDGTKLHIDSEGPLFYVFLHLRYPFGSVSNSNISYGMDRDELTALMILRDKLPGTCADISVFELPNPSIGFLNTQHLVFLSSSNGLDFCIASENEKLLKSIVGL